MMPLCENILDDPAASFWLKNALQSALNRDPVDALNDAEVLVVVLKERLDFVFNEEAAE
jgi:hypothetical protein